VQSTRGPHIFISKLKYESSFWWWLVWWLGARQVLLMTGASPMFIKVFQSFIEGAMFMEMVSECMISSLKRALWSPEV